MKVGRMQAPREAQRYPTRFQYSKTAPSYTLSPKFLLEKSWFSQTFSLAQETNKTEAPNSLQSDLQQKKVVGKQESRGWGIAAGAGHGPVQSLLASPKTQAVLGWCHPDSTSLLRVHSNTNPGLQAGANWNKASSKTSIPSLCLIVLLLGSKSVLKKAKACCAQTQSFFLFRRYTSAFKLSSFPCHSRGKTPSKTEEK